MSSSCQRIKNKDILTSFFCKFKNYVTLIRNVKEPIEQVYSLTSEEQYTVARAFNHARTLINVTLGGITCRFMHNCPWFFIWGGGLQKQMVPLKI